MKKIGLLLCALLVGGALSTGSASAHGWGWHHGWYWHGGGWHSLGGPVRYGPLCWNDTDSARGYGYYRWCDGPRRGWRGRHYRRWHHWHHW